MCSLASSPVLSGLQPLQQLTTLHSELDLGAPASASPIWAPQEVSYAIFTSPTSRPLRAALPSSAPGPPPPQHARMHTTLGNSESV